jgi:RNA polymerase sigma factor (sigma-70 family)
LAKWLDPAAEAALVQRLRDRDQDAAAELVRLCLPEFLGTARQSLKDPDAYAVSNEALERGMRAIGSFTPRPGATLRSWLFRILINCIRSAARKEKRLRAHEVAGIDLDQGDIDPEAEPIEGDPVVASAAVPTPVAESRVPAPAALSAVTSALVGCMSSRERAVMTLQAAGKSDAEIAAELKIKPGAVRVARLRARERAAEAIKNIAPTLDEVIQRRFRKLLN